MKYTIEGFDQQRMVEMGLNIGHAVILRWFVDFYGTKKMSIVKSPEEIEYKWASYQAIVNDLPLLRIKNREVIARYFNQMVEAGILEKFVKKSQAGTFTCFRLGDSFDTLLESRVQATQKSSASYSKVECAPD